MKAIEIEKDVFLESYLVRWERDITGPLLEWGRTINEAKLDQAKIDALFGDVEQKMSGEKTGLGKGMQAAGKAAKAVAPVLPHNLANKLHELIKDTKPVKAFDDAFERKKAEILAKYPKVSKIVDMLGDKAKKHPVMGAAVIGVLTTAAALATGGLGGFAVGAVLKTANDIMKGETLSKSLSRGVGAGLLGALAGLSLRELGDWLSNFDITSKTVPGYQELVKVKSTMTQTGMPNVYIETYMSRQDYARFEQLRDIANQAFSDGDYSKSIEINQKIGRLFNDPSYIDAMERAANNNKELVANAIEGSRKAAKVFNGLASVIQGATTGVASKKLDEADLKSIAGSIANWAKDKASATGKELSQAVTVKKLVAAWDKAGRPTDSDAIHNIMLSAGVPEKVLQQAFKDSKIPLPKDPSKVRKSRAKPVTISTGDAAFDKQINDMIATQGKDATIQYLNTLKQQAQAAATAPAKSKHGDVKKASDGQDYRLDVGKTGDRIWFNVSTGNEASATIDKELEGAAPKKRSPPRKRRPAVPKPKTQPAQGTPPASASGAP